MGRFANTAAFYDILARKAGRLEREGPFLVECLQRSGGRETCDLACGTGLHAQYLGEQGALVTAHDLSPGMVAYAAEHRSHPNVHYEVGDMRTLSGGPWRLALCLGNSLSLLPTYADLQRTFAAVSDSLIPAGVFVVQVINYGHPDAQKPRHRVVEAEEAGATVTAVKSLVPHGGKTLLTLTFAAWTPVGAEIVTDTAVLSHWGLAELQEAASGAGLKLSESFGGYDGTAFSPEHSNDLIAVFERPTRQGIARSTTS